MRTTASVRRLVETLPWLGEPPKCCDVYGRHTPGQCPRRQGSTRWAPRHQDQSGRLYTQEPFDPVLPTQALDTGLGRVRALDWLLAERVRLSIKGYPAVVGRYGLWVTLVYFEEEKV